MTTTRSAVTRVTVEATFRGGRPLVVTVGPGDVLVFREKGRRTSYLVTIEAAWIWAGKIYAEAERKRKEEDKKKRKEGGE